MVSREIYRMSICGAHLTCPKPKLCRTADYIPGVNLRHIVICHVTGYNLCLQSTLDTHRTFLRVRERLGSILHVPKWRITHCGSVHSLAISPIRPSCVSQIIQDFGKVRRDEATEAQILEATRPRWRSIRPNAQAGMQMSHPKGHREESPSFLAVIGGRSRWASTTVVTSIPAATRLLTT